MQRPVSCAASRHSLRRTVSRFCWMLRCLLHSQQLLLDAHFFDVAVTTEFLAQLLAALSNCKAAQ